jgi:hypothetical protein
MHEPHEILSIWRSPLDKAALSHARGLADCQPRCLTIGYGENFSAMTIYNFGYYVDTYTSSYNEALTQMLLAMQPGTELQGGLAFVPQQSFGINYVSGGFPFTVPDQSVIIGSGGGGTTGPTGGSSFFHFVITPTSASATTFMQCPSGSHTSGGVYFRSLAFHWLTSSFAKDTCIDADIWNVRVIRCTFTDCPTAFIADTSSLSCTLEQCSINYTVSRTTGPNSTKAVVLAAPECAVVGPGVFSQTSQAPESGGATGCACISIEGAEHAVIASMQLYEWTFGVDFSQGASGQTLSTHITNCDIECWQNALKIQLAGSGLTAAGVKVTSCTLAKTSDSTDDDAIVKINANGGDLHDVTLLDCTVFNMASAASGQNGVAIVSGSDIKIIGGTYSNNSSDGGAGIAITGAPSDVQIIGANLQPSYTGAPNLNSQQWALLLTADSNPAGVLVSGCDMTGYGSAGPVSVAAGSAPTYLFIVDCPGYNDRSLLLNGNAAPTTSTSASDCTTPYFGPSLIAYSNPSPVTLTIFGQTITAAMGIIFLPSPYDAFSFNMAPASFSWIGQ